jgi:hypothetical protein
MTIFLRIVCGVIGSTVLGLSFAFVKHIENDYLRFACRVVCSGVFMMGLGLALRYRNRGESNHQVNNP